MLLTFALLALSVCAVWAPPIAAGRGYDVRVWPFPFAAAVAAGVFCGALGWTAVAALALMTAVAFCSQHAANAAVRLLSTAVTALVALALALHAVPGFDNPTIVEGVRVSTGAPAFTQYASFDKAAAGLIVLAFFCRRCTSVKDWRRIVAPTVVAFVVTPSIVIGCAVLAGYVAFDPKLPSFTVTFLIVNLLFTCVAEEAFFRGLLQEGLTRAWPQARWTAVGVSALLFGLAHFAAGWPMIALATIAGLGYALAYDATRRIEAPILTHFAVNAIHFVGFTYPRLG